MTKDDHTMIRAAIATKHKYGTVTLTEYERQRCELLSGYKLEEIWIGKDNNETEIHTLDKNENGDYLILLELDELKKKQLAEAE
jgi:hypothetical protein